MIWLTLNSFKYENTYIIYDYTKSPILGFEPSQKNPIQITPTIIPLEHLSITTIANHFPTYANLQLS